MIFHWGAKRLLSLDTSKEEDDDQKDLAKHFMEFSHAIVSFLSLPRSLVTNRFQGRKKVMKVVKRELEERLAHPRDEQRDLLDLLVQDMMSKEDTLMTKEITMEITFLLLFAVLHNMPMTTTFAMKLLTDHPDVLEELSKEHDRVVSAREDGRSWICWEEYKSMTYIAMVVNEVLRLFSPFVLRKSLEDISVKGYRIPKGWLVIVHLASLHMDPELFLDPTSFNPSRWEMIFHWGAKRLLSLDTSKEEDDDQKDLAKHFMEFSHAIVSFLSLPRSLVTNRFQGRKKVMKVVKRELEERLAYPRDEQRDLLDLLVQDMMSKEDILMTKEIAMEIVFLLLFAVLHTMSMLTTFAIKFLSDHPDVLEELTKEHKRIVGEREAGRSWISWEEYKSMNYTAMVIKEVLRLVSPYVLRKSLQEINVKGYRIPKGWLVIVHLASVHMDPDLFPDPTSFNPSRWEDVKIASSCYMPFGGGPRLCAGMDFSKLFMTLFLHHLVTKYRWKTTKGVEIIQQPVWEFPDGFHIQLLPRS